MNQSKKSSKKSNKTRGFFLIEVVVAASVITVVLILLLGSIQNSVEASRRSLERTQASYVLEEGVEAVKSIRDDGWESNIETLENDTNYYLSWGGDHWQFTTDSALATKEGDFVRTIVFEPTYRDPETFKIVDSETELIDEGTRRVNISVSWPSPKGVKTEDLQFIIANIR